MTVEDTQRTSVTVKRVLGASRQFDERKASEEQPDTEVSDSTNAISNTQDAQKAMSLSDGWVWRLGSVGKLTAKEIEEWEAEGLFIKGLRRCRRAMQLTLSQGDRVHWFRAEAEMERWREQWEIKLAEFLRCIKAFDTMANTWSSLAELSPSRSREIYARKQSAVYQQLRFQVESAFRNIQVGEPTEYRRGEDVVDYIIRHRKTEIGTFHSQYPVQLFRVFN
ncbi:hypothetical protein NMY22_g16536 [Coprinellus aureogranulatus]|nr:hypothetical protein NMY22_g16536 [Coprinellus aureogranulatus]